MQHYDRKGRQAGKRNNGQGGECREDMQSHQKGHLYGKCRRGLAVQEGSDVRSQGDNSP